MNKISTLSLNGFSFFFSKLSLNARDIESNERNLRLEKTCLGALLTWAKKKSMNKHGYTIKSTDIMQLHYYFDINERRSDVNKK